ncbi:hypothetical protein GGR55DRAFT_664152 [Xylaria sp. FL0064]|nr:hypothetical protein GGR55DRAFT_664152 [Xylaria sp. FL0064]
MVHIICNVNHLVLAAALLSFFHAGHHGVPAKPRLSETTFLYLTDRRRDRGSTMMEPALSLASQPTGTYTNTLCTAPTVADLPS